jgi:integrase
LRKSLYGAERETTFAEAALIYLSEGGEKRYLAAIIKKIGPKKKMSELSGGFIRKIAKEMFPDLKPQTLNRYVVKPASAVIHCAHDHKLCALIKIRGFKPSPTRPRAAADQQWVAEFVHAADEQGWPYVGTYALFLHVTAARPKEAVALRPDNFDLDKKLGISDVTKTGTFRDFHLTDELVRRFRLYPAKELLWGKGEGELRVFGYADPKGPRPIWNAICEKARLPRFTPYSAGRHSYATTVVTHHKQDPKTSAHVGNWKDVKTMLDHYVKPADVEGFVTRNFEGILARNWQAPKQSNVHTIDAERKKAANEA